MEQNEVKKLLQRVSEGKISVSKAADLLLTEMGRGQRILIVDENLLGLVGLLSARNYTVYPIQTRGESDNNIKNQLFGRIFITKNGADFIRDTKKYHYGLVWVISKGPDTELVRK